MPAQGPKRQGSLRLALASSVLSIIAVARGSVKKKKFSTVQRMVTAGFETLDLGSGLKEIKGFRNG